MGDQVWRERGLRDASLAGDERAWQTLYDQSFAGLFAYVRWRCAGLHDLADEITQETWLTAVRRLASFDPEKGSFVNWLRGVAVNLLRNHLRRRKEVADRNSGAKQSASSDETEQRDRAEQIAHALSVLPEGYEAVLRAKYLEQQSVAEIASDWGQSEKAIESLLTRARAAFRELFPTPDLMPRTEGL